ncbi:MAG: hypothetical protein ACREOH_20640 [Candidatus Entotheonellia bacterium]
MDSMEGKPWLEDCQRAVTEFNDEAIPAFQQEWGIDDAVSTALMEIAFTQEDIQLDVGPRGVYLVEADTGFVYKIRSDGRVNYQKCIGHITGLSGKELFRQQWW